MYTLGWLGQTQRPGPKRECPQFCVNAVSLVSASVVGASSFLLVTLMPRIVGIIWLAGAAVKAERSEFISSIRTHCDELGCE